MIRDYVLVHRDGQLTACLHSKREGVVALGDRMPKNRKGLKLTLLRAPQEAVKIDGVPTSLAPSAFALA